MVFKSKMQMYNYWLATAHGLTPLKRQALLELSSSAKELFYDWSINTKQQAQESKVKSSKI